MYEEIARDFVTQVFDQSFRYAVHRNSSSLDVKDVTRAIRKISNVPPGDWQSLKLNKQHILHNSNYQNRSIFEPNDTHKKRLQMVNKHKKHVDKRQMKQDRKKTRSKR